MKINVYLMSNEENSTDNENFSNISESSTLKHNENKEEEIDEEILQDKYYTIKSFLMMSITLLLVIIILVLIFKKKEELILPFRNYFGVKQEDCNPKEEFKQYYSNKWIVMTTNRNPTEQIKQLVKVPLPWTIVMVERDKIENSKWGDFKHESLVYLSLEDQKALCYETTKHIPINSYARKNIGYLFAIQHGAREIFDADDDIFYKNYDIMLNNFDNWRLYYVDNNTQMVNPYEYFGRPDIWPRGFRFSDINKNNTNNYLSAMKSQFFSRIMVYQGIFTNFDLDSFYIKTNGFNNNRSRNISLHEGNPLIYLPTNYIPINSRCTRFLHQAFPALALPVTLSSRVSDIWRGYIMQRYIWGYNGTVLYTKSNSEFQGRNKVTSNFEEEKDLFFKLDKLLDSLNNAEINEDISRPGIFLIKLIEILVEKKILGEEDLNMYKAFIIDLDSFKFRYHRNYKIKINNDTKKYLNIPTQLKLYTPFISDAIINQNLHTDNSKLVRHYYTQKKYEDILLVINYNYDFLTKLNDYINSLYHQFFPNIIFVTPANTSSDEKVIACPESYKGYYSYYCIKRVYEKYPKMKGYLFAMDDVFIKMWELEYFSLDIPWIMSYFIGKTKNWPKDNDREVEMLNAKPKWRNNLRRFYNSNIIAHGISDFFYLPNNFVPDFIKVATELYKYRVFLELSVPSIYGIVSRPVYQFIHFVGLWNEDRKNWLNYLRTADKQIVIHPIKFSDINNQKEVIKYLYFKNAIEY